MNNLIKVTSAFRAIFVFRILKISDATNLVSQQYLKQFSTLSTLGVRITRKDMSQRSITSFFTKTPKKESVLEQNVDHKQAEKTPPLEKSDDVKEKRTSKRQRIESSGSEAHSPVKPVELPSPPTPEKKRPKRQRIDSSSSEPSPPASPKNNSEAEVTAKHEAEHDTPKTCASPKTNKSKPKEQKPPLAEKNYKDQKKSKVEKKPASKRKSSPVKSPAEQKAVDKRQSPFSKVSASKKEKEAVKTKKENVETNGKSSGTKSAEGKDSAPVAEEEYNPAKAKYHPIKDACWAAGQAVPYLALAKTLEAIEAISARLRIVEILSNYLRSVMLLTPEDLLPSIYMCLNRLAPAHHNVELGIAETYLMKAIGQSTGRTLSQTRAAAQRCGDLGLVAEQARATQRTMFAPPPLTARKVFATLKEIAGMTGQSSVNKKIGKIQTLYVACRQSEARYLIRSLAGKLRIGLAEQSVLQALALACATTPPGQTEVIDASKGVPEDDFKARVDAHALTIKSTYCSCPDYGQLVSALLEHGVDELPLRCRMAPGVPLKPMLAHPSRGVQDLFNRFEDVQFTCEWKYDGERAQIHVPSDAGGEPAPAHARAAIFSRNQEDNTTKYPDVLKRLPGLLKPGVTSCVLDAEAVAYDVGTKQILPFQILSTRKRKDAQESEIKVQVCLFLFDLLYLNGESLVARPLSERRHLLRDNFNEVEGEWQFATWKDCGTVDEVQQFLEDAVRGSCEGLMVKTLRGERSTYEIARRSHNWLKLKKDYLEGVGDTLDLVVLGGYLGKGKRAAAGYGGFLLGVREPSAEQLQTVCKIGTGFSDEALATLSERLEEHRIDAPKPYYRFDQSHTPDAWFSAALVWEVRCADLSLSPAHRAAIGLVAPDKGISLRFPRFVRVREDKTPEEATTAQQLAEMYLSQDQVKNQVANQTVAASIQDDFY